MNASTFILRLFRRKGDEVRAPGRGGMPSFGVILLLACIYPAVFSQQEPEYGFLDVKFGDTKEVFIEKMKGRFNMKPSFPITQWPMNGSGMDLLMTHENTFCLTNYKLGDRIFNVLFYFNTKGRFYGFRFKCAEPIGAEEKNIGNASGLTKAAASDLWKDVMFICKVFEKKYGSPSKSFEFTPEQIIENAERIFWLQDSEQYRIVAGSICFNCAQKRKIRYFGLIASVYDKQERCAKSHAIADSAGTPAVDSLRMQEEMREEELIRNAAESF